MSADYRVLAPIYNTIGMDRFAATMTPRLIDYAQRNDWMGRRILDLGCGTGTSVEWLTRRSYVVIGVDQSPDMLEICRKRLDDAGLNHDLRQLNLRDTAANIGPADLALALDVVNETSSLRDLEAIFRNVYASLGDGKLFIFDLHTVQGLAAEGATTEAIIHNMPNLTVIAQDQFDFERLVLERRYMIFERDEAWKRMDGSRTLRGYPAQAVGSLLQRCGFSIKNVINLDFADFEPGDTPADRIIFLAEKTTDG